MLSLPWLQIRTIQLRGLELSFSHSLPYPPPALALLSLSISSNTRPSSHHSLHPSYTTNSHTFPTATALLPPLHQLKHMSLFPSFTTSVIHYQLSYLPNCNSTTPSFPSAPTHVPLPIIHYIRHTLTTLIPSQLQQHYSLLSISSLRPTFPKTLSHYCSSMSSTTNSSLNHSFISSLSSKLLFHKTPSRQLKKVFNKQR